MSDHRPLNCRFRLQDERKLYPRSSCEACGKTITTGLGTVCTNLKDDPVPAIGDGVTRRDQFAMAALPACVTFALACNLSEQETAEAVYKWADAMEAARK